MRPEPGWQLIRLNISRRRIAFPNSLKGKYRSRWRQQVKTVAGNKLWLDQVKDPICSGIANQLHSLFSSLSIAPAATVSRTRCNGHAA